MSVSARDENETRTKKDKKTGLVTAQTDIDRWRDLGGGRHECVAMKAIFKQLPELYLLIYHNSGGRTLHERP